MCLLDIIPGGNAIDHTTVFNICCTPSYIKGMYNSVKYSILQLFFPVKLPTWNPNNLNGNGTDLTEKEAYELINKLRVK